MTTNDGIVGNFLPEAFRFLVIGVGSIVLFILFFVGVWHMSKRHERRRHARNRAYAEQRGWAFLAEDPALVAGFESPPFDERNQASATDVVRGVVRGRDFLVFEYSYKARFRKEGRTANTVYVCAVRVPGRIPLIVFSPETVATLVATAIGGVDIEVESEEFNQIWRVRSRDVRAAHALLTPSLIDRFLYNDLVGETIAFEPGFVVMCSQGRLHLLVTPLPFDTLCDIADLVPAFLAQDHPEG